MPFIYYKEGRFKSSSIQCQGVVNLYHKSLKVVANTASILNQVQDSKSEIILMMQRGSWKDIASYLSKQDCDLCLYGSEVIAKDGGVVRDYEKFFQQPLHKDEKLKGTNTVRINTGCCEDQYSYVYLITDGDFLKVGISKDPVTRLKGLQTANARKLSLVQTSKRMSREDAAQWEAQLHEKYKDSRVQGEWFSESILRSIKNVDIFQDVA